MTPPRGNRVLRSNRRSNSEDSFCHMIDSREILESTYGIRPDDIKTDLCWLQWRIRLNVESCSHQAKAVNKAHDSLDLSCIFFI